MPDQVILHTLTAYEPGTRPLRLSPKTTGYHFSVL